MSEQHSANGRPVRAVCHWRMSTDQQEKSIPRQRAEMRIGQMRQHEGAVHAVHELPIRIPAANTSTPPTTTWNAAARNGVSM